MFEKILIANRSDQLPSGNAVVLPNCMAAAGRKGDFSAEIKNV
ncbi:MAG: hypothetical protein Q8K61_08085 [Gallionella sp.]|jgi:hypothetical protein|nr:hypothetical protein [Gallionella sp.]